uniref:Uncharacterized protein n=1 Tax=Ananas comosus var. bracteatus TaxID=296719 RepID=A0A6V7PLZ7_ANACO|nr:unnamed protein product [Ananas comosus var. bracteatus]
MVDDRRFQVPVEIESWEDANPILLGEDMNARLGLETSEAQDRFIRQTRFSSIPAQDPGAGVGASGPPPLVSSPPPTGGLSSFVTYPLPPGGLFALVSISPDPGNPSVPACRPLSTGGPSTPVSRPAPPLGPPSFVSRPLPSGDPSSSVSRQPSPVGPLPVSLLKGPAFGEVGLADSYGTRLKHQTLHPGASSSVCNKLGSFRHSLRLASKNMGINKNSLQRAQDLMCSKLKTMKTSHFVQTSPAVMPVNSDLPLMETPLAPPIAAPSPPFAAPAPSRDLALPLTAPEIRKILTSCGINERVGPVNVRTDDERGASQAQEDA